MKRNTFFRSGSILLGLVMALWLFAGCGSNTGNNNSESYNSSTDTADSNTSTGGSTGNNGDVSFNEGNEGEDGEEGGDDSAEINPGATDTAGGTTGGTTSSTTTTTTGTTTSTGTATTVTNTFTATVSPAALTTTTSQPSFSWTPNTAAYKVYVVSSTATSITWGLKCATPGINCITGPVALGDQANGTSAVTMLGSAVTTLPAGTYSFVVETTSATGTLSQAGWISFTVQ